MKKVMNIGGIYIMLIYVMDALEYIVPAIFIWGCGYLLFQWNLYRRKERVSWLYGLIFFGFCIYMAAIFSVTVSPMYGFTGSISLYRINVVPFKTVRELFNNPLNVFGNIMMFVPVGFFLVLLSEKAKNFSRTLFYGFTVSLIIEIFQLFLGRGTDIDDIILNTFGTFLGYVLSMLIQQCIPEFRRIKGIRKKANDKIRRNDMNVLVVFTAFMLISVVLTGFYKRNAYMSASLNPENRTTLNSLDEPKIKLKEEAKKKNVKSEEKKIKSADVEGMNIYVMNADTGVTLYEKNSNEQIAPASTTKMLTALVVLRYCNIDEEVEVGDEINLVNVDASRAGLVKGNILTIKQLLDGLLLPSGNDAAYTLAAYTGEKIAADENLTYEEEVDIFVSAMNDMAKALGAEHSCFYRPDGYDEYGQYTTAGDLAIIANALLEEEVLREIVSSYKIRDVFSDGTDITFHNTNELINPESPYFYANAIGLKTGSSGEAGNCLVSAAKIKGNTYISVVMGSSEEGRWKDSLELYHNID